MYPYSYYSVTPCYTFLPLFYLPSSLIPSLTCLTHSLIHSLPCLSHSLCHSFSLAHFAATHFLTHLRLCIILSHSLHCLTHSLTHSPVSLTLLHSLPHLLLPCLTHSHGSLIYSLSHSLTNFPTSLIPASLTHSLIHSLLHPFLCFTHSLIHSTVSFTSLSHSRPDIHSVAILCLTLPASSLYQWMVWSHNSMTHWKLLSTSNSTITVIQSGCHRTYKISWNFMIRWAHDGITRASRSRIAFLRQSITFLFPSYCFHDVKKKGITRSKNEEYTISQDALTMALWRAKWIHELNTKMNLRKVIWKFSGMPKILPPHTKFLPDPEKRHTWSNDGLRCPHGLLDVFTIRADYEHFLFRVSIWCQLRDSVTPVLRNVYWAWRLAERMICSVQYA